VGGPPGAPRGRPYASLCERAPAAARSQSLPRGAPGALPRIAVMRLADLAAAAGQAQVVGDPDVDVLGLAYDSRKAGPGTLFFCVVGEKRDGHEFAGQVVEAGAVALVVERELDVGVPQVVVPSARAAMAPFAAAFWGDPTAELKVVGVTGTNGKTTTAYLTREILEAAGIQTGLMGTVKQVVGGEEEPVERTTPEAIDLQETFRRMLARGDRACAMEVSSHALVLHRADAIHFDVAIFTNLTQDHLDFHADMEDYFAAKRMLFADGERAPGVRIVNVDDPYGRRLAAELDCLTFSAEGADADYRATDVEFDAGGATFTVSMGRKLHSDLSFRPADDEVRLKTGMPGHFNVANALGAFAAARALGVDAEVAAGGLAAAARVPGRFEPIDEGQGFAVLVDYAHTPDSMENVLRAARRLTDGRLISVFGAGGDRDKAKRPLMGRAGGTLSDLAVVTSDNPRSEDPEAIVAEVAAGAGEGDAELIVEVDRHAAIALALGRAEPGDTVVIAGKGHEQGQEFEGGRKIPFDDRQVAREELRKLGSPA
jgi:UDP-N-acetylmuramoyl-L-alanyl-D-glutamate--2,6-diaminopimelate ligase